MSVTSNFSRARAGRSTPGLLFTRLQLAANEATKGPCARGSRGRAPGRERTLLPEPAAALALASIAARPRGYELGTMCFMGVKKKLPGEVAVKAAR